MSYSTKNLTGITSKAQGVEVYTVVLSGLSQHPVSVLECLECRWRGFLDDFSNYQFNKGFRSPRGRSWAALGLDRDELGRMIVQADW